MFKIEFKDLNDALKVLPYARVFQSPIDRPNEFHLEVKEVSGGNFESFKLLRTLAEEAGYKYDTYFERMDLNGDYCYSGKFFVENGEISVSYGQDNVRRVK